MMKDTVAREKRVHYETEEYIAFYRKEEEYLSLYENFILVDKEYLSQYDNQHEVGSIICIFHTK